MLSSSFSKFFRSGSLRSGQVATTESTQLGLVAVESQPPAVFVNFVGLSGRELHAFKMVSGRVLAVLVVGAAFLLAVNAEVMTLTDDTYADNVKKEQQADTLWFVNFYAPWCPWSQKLAPTWEQLGEDLEGEAGIEVGAVDCTTSKATCANEKIQGYPTMKAFYNGEEVNVYFGDRDLESLRTFVLLERFKRRDAKAATQTATQASADEWPLGEAGFSVGNLLKLFGF